MRISRQQREALNGHRAGVVYLTGLSGAGKSTLAALIEHRLHAMALRTYVLDGDELRTGLCKDLGFCDADRIENVRRVTETARLMVDAGLVVIAALISPFRAERDAARARFAPGEFIEVFVDAPLSVCEARDPKGLYKRARRGEIAGFTGIDSRYEAPLHADFRVDTMRLTPDEAAATLLAGLAQAGFLFGAPAMNAPRVRT
jgi:adenylyl-sulfate kinase